MRDPILIYLMLATNICVFVLYAVDKMLAKAGWRRISERTLLIAAACGGAVGAALAMGIVRHKTRKTRFRIIVPLLLILQVVAVLYLCRIIKL